MKKYCRKCELVAKNNQTMKEQAMRIVELKKEVNDLSIELENYRKKEIEINQLLAFAKKQSEEIIREAKTKYALECQRLRVYRNKWMRYIKDKNRTGRLAEDIEKTNAILKECQTQLEDMLYTDLGINQSVSDSYIYERERIDDEPSLNYQSIIKEHIDSVEEKLSSEELEQMMDKLRC